MNCFAALMYDIFPNVSGETKRKLHEHIRKRDLYTNWLFSIQNQDAICQGDIVKEVPFVTIDRDGKGRKKTLPALLLNNTCDIQTEDGKPRSEFLSIIPLIPYESYIQSFQDIPNYETNLKENVITDKFFVAGLPYDDQEYVADLSTVCSLSTQYLHNKISQGQVKKVTSLSENGYYFFLAKITLHLMRPETREIEREELR